jgi:nucleotide-binding universal stress UspA family protein
MGHSGHASIGGLGSTAFDVLHHANVPVLIVPKNAPSPSATHQLEGLNILLAVDGSQAADEATEWLNQVAPLWSAKIALFCVARDVVPTSGAAMAMPGVVQPVGPGAGVYWLATDSEPAGWEEAANLAQEETERTLKQARMLLTNCPPVSEEIGHGAPAASIVDYADSHGADLIVMGRRGHSLIGNIFNSVSYSVVQHAPVPVLVVTSTSDQEHS